MAAHAAASGRFDPADRTIAAAVNHIVASGSSIFEEQRRCVAQVEHHDRVRHAHFGNVGARLGDNRQRLGRFLGIGLVVLGLCFIAIRALDLPPDASPLLRIAEQSLLILGWVANWRPIEIFLYEWLPLYRQIRLYDRIAAAQVALQPI